MHTEATIEIDASRDRVWQVIADVERWPEWAESMQRVQLLNGPVLDGNSRARIKQPSVPAKVWSVTQLEPGKSFTWETKGPGMKTVAYHEITETGATCQVLLSVTQSGPAAFLMAPWLKYVSRKYLDMEAQGLKQRCESGA